MSDHIDGPRTTADASIDLTDLFAFTSPADPQRTVVIANAFPFAGESGLFSNAVNYSVVLRRVRQTGMGHQARFKPYGAELRFIFQFDVLKAADKNSRAVQTGHCQLPDGTSVPIVVGEEKGFTTSDGKIRVFAGVRSDPFFIGWVPGSMQALPNYLEHDNVLSMVIDFDSAAMLDPKNGTLYGVIAETTPRHPNPHQLNVSRYDWVGRPEQTNFLLNGIVGAVDLRDLWNQETPFDLNPQTRPLYQQRLLDSFKSWDMHDGKVNWEPAALEAHVNVRLDDFLLFDIAKPINDLSNLEIEKSALENRPSVTGGGRTLNANVIDILVTWVINRDQGPFWQSPATQATQPGGTTFPYVQPPNVKMLTVSRSVELAASAQDVWKVVGSFGALWHPLVAQLTLTGEGNGQLRQIETIDGKMIVERLSEMQHDQMTYRYTLISGVPASPYSGTFAVQARGAGSSVSWTVDYRPAGQGDLIVRLIISTLLNTGMAALKTRFGALK